MASFHHLSGSGVSKRVILSVPEFEEPELTLSIVASVCGSVCRGTYALVYININFLGSDSELV